MHETIRFQGCDSDTYVAQMIKWMSGKAEKWAPIWGRKGCYMNTESKIVDQSGLVLVRKQVKLVWVVKGWLVTARHSSYHQHGAGLIGGGKPGWHRAGGKVGLTSMANLLPLTLFFYFTCWRIIKNSDVGER